MDCNPLSEVRDRPIEVTPDTIKQLSDFLYEPKFTELPGIDNDDEKQELTELVDGVLRALIEDISDNPSKLWVMKQFCPALELVEDSDTEVRDHFGEHMEKIMDILKIESSDHVLGFYLGFC